MSTYPLSTKSSKKSHKTSLHSHSPLMQRSACQNEMNKVLKPQIYGQILTGQRVFIEMYYQGRVVTTQYNKYLVFMGAIVSKRLTNKVTIFLTNVDEREAGPVRERVKRVCPNCRIVNIMWFQQCFQAKEKVPFGQYAMDTPNIKEEEAKTSKDGMDLQQLDNFLGNICEDAENEFKDFFKNDKKKYFTILPKNHNKNPYEVMPAREIELAANPDKKGKNRNDARKRRKSMSRKGMSEQNGLSERKRGMKSMGTEGSKGLLQDEEKQEQTNLSEPQEDHQFFHRQQRLSSLQNLMSKYLGIRQKNSPNNDESVTLKSKRSLSPIVSKISENVGTSSKNLSGQMKISEKVFPGQISKKTVQSTFVTSANCKINPKHRFTFSSIGTKYKDAYCIEEPDPSEMEKIEKMVKQIDENSLVVLTPSRAIQTKIAQINAQATNQSSIKLLFLHYKHFRAFSSKASKEFTVYYLLNSKKASDRAFYFALLLQKLPLKLKIVSHRLVEEVIAYNIHIKNISKRSPIKLQPNKIKFLKEIKINIEKQSIMGKKVAFLQSELPPSLQKKVIQALGGIFVMKQDYLLSADLDLIVTDKYGLKEKGIQTVNEQTFWRRVIRLQGQSQ